MLNQFKNLSCYEEFEIQVALTGISKIDILKKNGYQIDNYYFFIPNDGIFNWFDLKGNHIKDSGVLKELKAEHIPITIIKCIIPNSVISIGTDAFCYCNYLNKVIIPNSVTYIGIDAFYNCYSLEEITIPDSVTNIGYGAFAFCKSLEEITIPNTVTDIDRRVFYYCKSLNKVIIPNSVTSIGSYAFAYCKSLTSITIPDGVTSIGDDAFWLCKSLKEVIFKGKTLEEVKQMETYPFGIEDENVFKSS